MGSNAPPAERGRSEARPEDLVARAVAELPAYLPSQRWFGNKSRTLRRVTPLDHAAVPATDGMLALFELAYADGGQEDCLLALRPGDAGGPAPDALDHAGFCGALVEQVRLGGSLQGLRGTFRFTPTGACAGLLPAGPLAVARVQTEQSNTSVVLGGRAILKVFRKLEPGPNPDLEITDFLTRHTAFRGAPRLAGSIVYHTPHGEPTALGLLQEYVPNRGDAWTETQGRLAAYYAAAASATAHRASQGPAAARALAAADAGDAARLGALTGRLHMALASAPAGTPLAPAVIEPSDLVAWLEGMRDQLDRMMATLRGARATLPAPVREIARQVLAEAPRVRDRLSGLQALGGQRLAKIRVHGDYHLGQVLRASDAFVILDFEGEPGRPLAERRATQCALKDVAGMLRSFAYAAQAAVFTATEAAPEDPDRSGHLAPWAAAWEAAIRTAFLEGYLAETLARGAAFLPRRRETLDAVLRVFELDKAIYEVGYELNHRPAWLRIPLAGLRRGAQR